MNDGIDVVLDRWSLFERGENGEIPKPQYLKTMLHFDLSQDEKYDLENQFKPFGYDWLGRCFSLDLRKETAGNVLMFEIGTNDVLEIPCSFKDFLNQEIPLYTEECLAKSFFDEWKEFSNAELKYGRCAGYKVPLFLGGEDDVSNLEDSDMEVYWEIMTQIAAQL